MIKGIIFDKDGTLFDFNATWGAWSCKLIEQEAGGDPQKMAQLADVLGYDMDRQAFLPGSLVIAETIEVVADAIMAVTQATDKQELMSRMNAATIDVPQVPAAPLLQLLTHLRDMGLRLGVATNDSEGPARAHLAGANVLEVFDFVVGYDSGFGGKPAAGQLLAFCEQTGLAPSQCAMVGDSLHDLEAGRAAGMTTVGVLTGPAPRQELAPIADVVLTSIAELPLWVSKAT